MVKKEPPLIPDGARLEALFKLVYMLNPNMELDEAINLVVKKGVTVIPAERCAVVFFDDRGKLQEKKYNLKGGKNVDICHSIILKTIKRRKPILVMNALEDKEFKKHDSVRRLGLKSILTVPIELEGEFLGVVYVDNRALAGGFSTTDSYYLTALSNLLLPYLKRARRGGALDLGKNGFLDANPTDCRFGRMIGRSKIMAELFRFAESVKDSRCPILITGEEGTGKSTFARSIYDASGIYKKGFFVVETEELERDTMDSYLFGEQGYLRKADGGTVYIKEVTLLPLDAQRSLLKVIEKDPYQPVDFDVRIIASTSKDIWKEASERRFKKALLSRLSVVHIHIPPLRDRKGDIPLLAAHFLISFCEKHGKNLKGFTEGAMEKMRLYTWPGNVRELEERVERACFKASPGSYVTSHDLGFDAPVVDHFKTLEEFEREYISSILQSVGHNKSLAADVLGISRRTLYYKLRKYGLT